MPASSKSSRRAAALVPLPSVVCPSGSAVVDATGVQIPVVSSAARSSFVTEPPGKTYTSGIKSLWITRRTINTSIPCPEEGSRSNITAEAIRGSTAIRFVSVPFFPGTPCRCQVPSYYCILPYRYRVQTGMCTQSKLEGDLYETRQLFHHGYSTDPCRHYPGQ